jgi:hypothetical protein
MPINLTKSQIDATLPRVACGLEQYLWLQANLHASDVSTNRHYQRRFNRFYRVRRNSEWQRSFYGLLENYKGKSVEFREILSAMQVATGRYEASFASKLLATVDPDIPIIDSIVLRNLQLRLPAASTHDRADRIQELHTELLARFKAFLATENGEYLVARFRETYPHADITEIKMLDLVLWQTRPKQTKHGFPADGPTTEVRTLWEVVRGE